jgi:2,4-dienoyl-CoA reductase-like NADH-dependent reductase (Old Yellow Enzyme family)
MLFANLTKSPEWSNRVGGNFKKAVDSIAMRRPLIRQPDLPDLWRSGEGPDKAECFLCNACLPDTSGIFSLDSP